MQTPFPGGMTPSGIATGFSTPSADLDLIKIGEARKSLVGVKLDQVTVNTYILITVARIYIFSLLIYLDTFSLKLFATQKKLSRRI